MRTLVLGSLGMVGCWTGSSSQPTSRPISDHREIAVIDAEAVLGRSRRPKHELAREQAIEQARAAGILRETRPPTPTTAAPTGPLDQASIRREVRAHLKPITQCYEQRLGEDVTLQGTTKVTFVIGSDGSVTSSIGSGFDVKIDACVAKVVRGIMFPAPAGGGAMQVRYPFTFRPSP